MCGAVWRDCSVLIISRICQYVNLHRRERRFFRFFCSKAYWRQYVKSHQLREIHLLCILPGGGAKRPPHLVKHLYVYLYIYRVKCHFGTSEVPFWHIRCAILAHQMCHYVAHRRELHPPQKGAAGRRHEPGGGVPSGEGPHGDGTAPLPTGTRGADRLTACAAAASLDPLGARLSPAALERYPARADVL